MATVTSGRVVIGDAGRCGGQVVQVSAGIEDLWERSRNG